MTLPFNPLRAADLARQAMEPEATPTEQCSAAREDGYWTVQCAYVAGHSGEHLFSRGDASDEIRLKLLRDNRDQRETLLREMAEQLMAAVQEVERLRAIPAADIASLANQLWEDDRDSLRASCEQLTRERDEERKEVLVLRHLVKRIDETLRVPAAEYVPAISDVFSLIDALSSTHQAGTK